MRLLQLAASMVLRTSRYVRNCVRVMLLRARLQNVAWEGRLDLGVGVRISATDGGTIRFGRGVTLGDGVAVVAMRGHVEIGDFVFIGPYTTVVARDGIEIGSHCLIAERVSIRDQDHRIHADPALPISHTGFETGPISIGDGSWIAAGAAVLKGARIGRGAVVAANAVVRDGVSDLEVVGGVPARRIGLRSSKP